MKEETVDLFYPLHLVQYLIVSLNMMQTNFKTLELKMN